MLDVIRSNPGRRANELATLIGKSVQSVERYVKTLKDDGVIEFRGAPKNGGYYVVARGRDGKAFRITATTPPFGLSSLGEIDH